MTDAQHVRYFLASASPRRRELMEQAGLSFTVMPAEGEERVEPGASPEEVVRALSRQKAEEVADRLRDSGRNSDRDPKEQTGLTPEADALVIGADTVVSSEGEILGKPRDLADAKRMLTRLSGRTHEVWTGVTIIQPGKALAVTFAERTEVDIDSLSEEEIDAYLAAGESLDKAGAYGIQGRFAVHIRGIRGDFYNVMGLPIAALYRVLRRNGWV